MKEKVFIGKDMHGEKVIRLYFCDPCVLTWQQYEAVKRDVEARALAGCKEEGDRVLAQLLLEHFGRYQECKESEVAS